MTHFSSQRRMATSDCQNAYFERLSDSRYTSAMLSANGSFHKASSGAVGGHANATRYL